ncbi:synaptic vesicle 2-related protein-like [Amphiura filiformis]|uniref:synaptic vesicle 2-related protein-like n=1 Tax=Amphiura filiformis TaxID=82378 RepID=UPI003B211078
MEPFVEYHQQLQDDTESTGANYHSMDVRNFNEPMNKMETRSYHSDGDTKAYHQSSELANGRPVNETINGVQYSPQNDGQLDFTIKTKRYFDKCDHIDDTTGHTHSQYGSCDDGVGNKPKLGDGQASADGPVEFTVEEAIDQLGFGRFQIQFTLIDSVLHMSEAGEVMLLSILGPELVCSWHLEHWQEAIISTVVFFGYLLGAPLWGKFADKFGRRKILNIVAVCLFYYGALTAFSPTFIWITVLRGIVGACDGGAGQVNVLYSEFLPSKDRGFWLTAVSLSWIFGAVYVTAVGLFVMPTLGWRYVVFITGLPLLIYIACTYILPESAHYYAACGKREEAMATLKKVSEVNKKPLPEGTLKVGLQEDQRGTFGDLFLDKTTSITTVLLVFIWFSMQFVYYGVILLSSELFAKGNVCAGAEQNAASGCFESCQSLTSPDYVSLIWTTLAEFPGALITLIIIDVIGRKKTMVVQSIIAGIFIFMLFMCTSRFWLTVYLFVARGMIGGALQTVHVYTPEVYPTHMRGLAYGALKSMGKTGSMVTPFFAQMLLHTSPKLTLSVYGGFCFVSCIFIILLPIETKGRKLLSSYKTAVYQKIDMHKE